jgi:signal transduction histidine kinase
MLEVRDDGIGFDPDADYAGHLGLRSMRERAAKAGGVLEVTSRPHETWVRLVIPAR